MAWLEITLTTTHEASELITDTLLALGAEGVYTEDPYEFDQLTDDGFGIIKPEREELYDSSDVTVKAYIDPDLYGIDELETLIKTELQQLQSTFTMDFGPLNLSITIADESGWDDWKMQYPPISMTEHLTIIPDWAEYSPHEEERVIRIEPGIAFGTGDHPTTRLAIQAMSQYLTPESIVFDVGTGSGIIALSAGALGAQSVTAFDLDETATANAQHHVDMNQLGSVVQVQTNNLLEGISATASIIVANIITPILLRLLEDAYRCLEPKGVFIMSGIQEGEEQELITAATTIGFVNISTTSENSWICITCHK
ncbi:MULTISPECIES: 50S ribosomal protein L11 methyltransferase [unclassified Veillonella]|uniref:50S ribosomal protein L11 methyltransferase n=1 Tax=unclassified Veillonella TaxID=2630086 RepID=UPI000F8C69A9|nr:MULTISPECIES: 50S ribosomal protein L11 methyltransferase [unclassified Veillonella]